MDAAFFGMVRVPAMLLLDAELVRGGDTSRLLLLIELLAFCGRKLLALYPAAVDLL